MVRTGWLVALVVALTPWPCQAQGQAQDEEDWTVRLETFNGQTVTGKLRLASVEVACSLGLYEIKPGKIKTIELSPAAEPTETVPGVFQREGTVVTKSGEKVVGKITVPSGPGGWRVETELGALTPDAQQLKTLTIVARGEAAKTPTTEPALPAKDVDAPAEPEKKP